MKHSYLTITDQFCGAGGSWLFLEGLPVLVLTSQK